MSYHQQNPVLAASQPPEWIIEQHNADPLAHENLARTTVCVSNTTDTTVNVTFYDNTLYTFTQPLTSLTLNADSGLWIAGLNFKTGGTATTFTTPGTWVFNGDDCTSQKAFIPKTNAVYRVGVESVNNKIYCDVQRSEG